MTEDMCRKFFSVWADFSDQLDKGNYKFNDDGYCEALFTDNKCNADFDKINAVCFWLFKQIMWDSSSSSIKEKINTNIIHYIMTWLIYMLRLKNDDQNDNVAKFNNKCINYDMNYISSIKDTNAYNIYKNFIDNKLYLMNTGIKDISKFYDAFRSLCNMYNEFNEDNPVCSTYLMKANEFVQKYNALNSVSDITEDDFYYQILSALSNDYDNFKKKCDNDQSIKFPSLSPIKKAQSSAISYDVASSSSTIASKLIPALLICSIPIFLGISYKYSLFGFDKRLHKQYLREKVKKIKKKMNHYI
ncbi:CIR protein [Plasmodium chabaudi adami]|uniref:CIR protein n=1 Tax=Plasmodium chabaudi adami TaxID=5826 RepID=A0A1C6WFY2_PLACE|nr:CIR protein [Plasmodium chabaudi adami]